MSDHYSGHDPQRGCALMLAIALPVSVLIWLLALYGAAQLLGVAAGVTLAEALYQIAKWASAAVFVIAAVLLVLYLAMWLHSTEAHRDARRRNRHGDRF